MSPTAPKNRKRSLVIKNLHVQIKDKEIIHGINLEVRPGELHVIMGPNGSGKSTFAYALVGHPEYKIKYQSTKIQIGRRQIQKLSPDKRAKLGLMLAFQNPVSVPGLSLSHFLRSANRQLHPHRNTTVIDFHKRLIKLTQQFGIPESWLSKGLNDNFSQGEKKRLEMLQMMVLEPKYLIIDEIDSGLDIDSLKIIARAISTLQENNIGIILITHYRRILDFLKTTNIHILVDGRIVKKGAKEIIQDVETKGYAQFQKNYQ